MDAIKSRHQLDSDVLLGVQPGRKIKGLRPLILGKQARIRSGSVLYDGSRIGSHFETGHHVIIREENHIGDHVSVWNNTTIDYGCRIGNGTKIHCNCYIAQYSILEEGVFLAPGVILANDLFPGGQHASKVLQGPIIRKGAKIGVNCTILPGVTIGKGALIGAGSVVTRDVAPESVVFGNPARLYQMKGALHWPKEFKLTRPAADRFFRARLSGQPAYSRPFKKA